MKAYREFHGVSYDEATDKAVIYVIDNLIGKGVRVRLFLGDTETGRDWCEEYDVTGTISLSMGPQKVPILLASKRSSGGGAILTHCILRIDTKNGTIYRHPKYHAPEYTIVHVNPPLPWMVERTDGANRKDHVSSFETEAEAARWVAYMRGERWSK